MAFTIVENGTIVADDIKGIYEANGWGVRKNYLDEQIEQMFKSVSFYCLCLDEDDNLVGFLKAFSDSYAAHLTEILVLPASQRKGAGRLMMKAFINRYSYGAIYVTGVGDTFGFFEQFGFQKKEGLYACSKRTLTEKPEPEN